jgi:cyclophilin family peptidyl-prolyl cis-trans isomerase
MAAMDAATRAGPKPEIRSLLEEALRSPHQQVKQLARFYNRTLFDGQLLDSRLTEVIPRLSEYAEILSWAEKPRAAVITVERPGFIPGAFTVKLDTEQAPLSSWNFAQLAEGGFYDGREIVNVVPGRLAQSGGAGSERHIIPMEISPAAFEPGTIAFPPYGSGYSDSRWFISLTLQPQLGRNRTAFGRVVQNLDGVVSLLLPGDRIVSVRIYEGDGSEELQLE